MEKRPGSMPSCPSTPTSPSPTTFVQADPNSFRELVQRLTGATQDVPTKLPVTVPARTSPKPAGAGAGSSDATGPRRSSFKLQERRHTMRKLEIKLGLTSLRNSPNQHSPRQTHRVDSPIRSPVSPLASDCTFSARTPSSGSESPASEEERAIAEKGFYLHPSPLNTPRKSEPPELLALFPLTSPRQQSRNS